MLVALVLMFAIGWFASAGSWGLVVVFSLLELVELARRGREIVKANEKRITEKTLFPRGR